MRPAAVEKDWPVAARKDDNEHAPASWRLCLAVILGFSALVWAGLIGTIIGIR